MEVKVIMIAFSRRNYVSPCNKMSIPHSPLAGEKEAFIVLKRTPAQGVTIPVFRSPRSHMTPRSLVCAREVCCFPLLSDSLATLPHASTAGALKLLLRRSQVSKVQSLEASDGLGQHEKDPESEDGCCYCPRIYGERDFKTFGYLLNIRKPRAKCTEKEIDMIYEKATAMNAAVTFADDTLEVKHQRERVAQQLWTDSRRTAAWGCRWYVVWLQKVQEAVRRKQRLKVVFFPNEVGKGCVSMKDLPTSNLWDGVGCGGSQKCEIATLEARRGMGWCA